MNNSRVINAINFLNNEVHEKRLPGATLHVSYKGETFYQGAIGYKTVYPELTEMKVNTIFDLASLTKVIATLPAILKLIDNKILSLDSKVVEFLPGFGINKKENITLKHLLTHTSGLQADDPMHFKDLNETEILEELYNQKLVVKEGTKVIYSDLGMILIYFIINSVVEEGFANFVKKNIFKPLGMTETGFNPTFNKSRFAATEYSKERDEYKLGIVHDEKAEAMGGISGHAGLFSSVNDLASFATMFENQGFFNNQQILSKEVIELSKKNYTPFEAEHKGLGWVINNPKNVSSCCFDYSDKSYGHTGFTGTSIWFDPVMDLHIIFLTNRVHFGRGNNIATIRAKLHEILIGAISH